jgi:hypothetical protein
VNTRSYALLGALCTSLLLSACQTAPPAPPEKVVEEPSEDMRLLHEVLAYAPRIAQMSAEEQKRELNTWTQAMARERGDRATAARIRTALLLTEPGSAAQDDARAQTMLEPYANVTPNAGALRQFGAVLHDQIAERQRAAKRTDQLKEQLEALRAVERSIIERGKKPPTRKP